MPKSNIVIGWLYPELMNTYGDRGNIIIFKNRCLLRDIEVEVKNITLENDGSEIESCDFLFMGGAQDKQQALVYKDFHSKKNSIQKAIDRGIPGVYVCGAYQLLGEYYMMADNTKIDGLGIFKLHTENPGTDKPRLIGNIITNTNIEGISDKNIIGFENHGGRTYLDDKNQTIK